LFFCELVQGYVGVVAYGNERPFAAVCPEAKVIGPFRVVLGLAIHHRVQGFQASLGEVNRSAIRPLTVLGRDADV